jgi:hypothetical protein
MPLISRFALTAGVLCLGGLVWAQTPPVPATTPAAPAPATATTSEYYPLKNGNKWTYRIDEQRSLEMKVDKFENGEATIVTMAGNRQVAKDTIQVKGDGIYRTKINDLAITPPIKILELPVKKGTSWEIKSKVQDKEIIGKLTVKDEKEKLKLKDGKEYDCVMVDGPDFKVDGSATKMKLWFCAGKGIVKLSYETGQQEAVLELSDFVEGK